MLVKLGILYTWGMWEPQSQYTWFHPLELLERVLKVKTSNGTYTGDHWKSEVHSSSEEAPRVVEFQVAPLQEQTFSERLCEPRKTSSMMAIETNEWDFCLPLAGTRYIFNNYT